MRWNVCWGVPATRRWVARSRPRCRRWPGPTCRETIKATLADGKSRTLPQVRLSTSTGGRILEVKVLVVAGGAALLWHDITERMHAERDLKQTGERLALAAEGANDGLWQWNLQTQEFYVSGRWRAMIGLPAHADIVRSRRMARARAPGRRRRSQGDVEDAPRRADPVFQHEHRIRHEDGTYRRFLCRGLAVKDGRNRRDRIAGSLTDTTEQAIAQERLRSVGFLDPLTGLYNRAVFVEGLGRRLEEFKLRRDERVVRRALSRSRPVQDRQRQSGPPGRRRAADRRLAPARVVPAPRRRAGPARRRRIRDSPERARRRRTGQRHRLPDSGGAERAVLDRRPRGVHLGEHRHRLRSGALHESGRGHARRRHRDVSRQGARQGAARSVRRGHARARARSPQPRERPAPGGRHQRLRGALSADRVPHLRDVRRVRVAGPLDAQRRGGLAGHLRADCRGARADRAARHLGDAAGVLHVRRLAAAVPRAPAWTASRSTCRAGS